jgi:ActR/RegA family two-component response regulator
MVDAKGRILILEDDPEWGVILQDLLGRRGFVVRYASSYAEALRALRAELFHVAIIDLRLTEDPQDQSGMDLLRHIAQSDLDVPNCIVLTAYGTVETARDAFRDYKVWDFFSKFRLSPDELVTVVEEAAEDAIAKTRKVPSSLQETWDITSQNTARLEVDEFSFLATRIAYEFAQLLGLSDPVPGAVYGRLVAVQQDVVPIFSYIRLAPQIPVFFLKDHHLVESDLDDLRYLFAHRLNPSVRVAFLILFGQAQDVENARLLLNERLRRPYAYDIFPMGWEDILRVVASRDPHRSLRRMLLSAIDLLMVSPFVTSAPVPNNMFFGREVELREIVEHATTANYALIGGRRIGKTSILYHLKLIRLLAVGLQSYYLDCSTTLDQASFLEAFARVLLLDLSDRSDPFRVPQKALESFTRLVDQVSEEEPIIILLDEVDKLILADRAAGYPLFTEFRALAQRNQCKFVLAGERVLREALRDPAGPLFNFGSEMLVGRLGFRAVKELVTRPMKQLEIELIDEGAIVRNIYDFTSGHPNVVQRLCQRLIIRLNERQHRRITSDDVEAVIADPGFLRRDFLDTFWERASILEKLVSLVMIKDGMARTLRGVRSALTREGIKADLNSVDSALERLVDLRNILKRTPTGYEFAVTAFSHVLSQSQRLDDLIALNRDFYQAQGDTVVIDHSIPEEQ